MGYAALRGESSAGLGRVASDAGGKKPVGSFSGEYTSGSVDIWNTTYEIIDSVSVKLLNTIAPHVEIHLVIDNCHSRDIYIKNAVCVSKLRLQNIMKISVDCL